MPEQISALTTEYGGETMEKQERDEPKLTKEGVFQKITPEERRKVLGNLEKYISTEGMGCVVCPCYTACSRC